MHKSEILTLFDYNYWATGRVLGASEQVTAEQFTAPAQVSFGSRRGTLVHILSTEMVWRKRCQEAISPGRFLDESDFPTVGELVASWRSEQSLMMTFLEGLQERDLGQEISYATTKGVPHKNTLWQILVHVVNHGTQFRAEAGVVLANYGHSPGDLDFILFLRKSG